MNGENGRYKGCQGFNAVRPRRKILFLVAIAFAFGQLSAYAAVSPDEALSLNADLTPVGAERAANADGSIPAWTGGYTVSSPGYQQGAPRPDPFSDDGVLFSITSQNFRDYSERLPEGAKVLFERFPDYRMDIYPTHRSAAAPSWVYDNIFRNATRAHAGEAGIVYGVEGAIGGIPFPIPENGFEAVWNHLLGFWGAAREINLSTYVVAGDGTITKTASYREIADFPYYYPNATPESINGYYFKTLRLALAPPERIGGGYLNLQPIDTERFKFAAWRLIAGQHRARMAPSISYDVPDPDAAGFMSLDDYYLFFGGLDHYNFHLIGKKELYIPYNNNRLYTRPVDEILSAEHANPDTLRYERHRVWVIEGVLAEGQHNIIARRRLYLDEDTWFAVYSDAWDEQGQLWRFGHATMYLMPDVPAVILGSQFNYDFELGGYVYSFAFNGEPSAYKLTKPHSQTLFTPYSLSVGSNR